METLQIDEPYTWTASLKKNMLKLELIIHKVVYISKLQFPGASLSIEGMTS